MSADAVAAPPAPVGGTAARARRSLEARRDAALVVAIALITGAATIVSHGAFWDGVNLRSLLVTIAITAIPATGMTIVILTGGIDVSIGSMLGLVAALGGALFARHWPLALVAPIFPLLGAAFGVVNAVLTGPGRVPPVVATLGLLSIYRMAVFLFMGSEWITAIPASLTTLFIATTVAGLPVATVLALALMAATGFVLRRHRLGRHVYAVGNNDEAARLAGIRVERIRFASYVGLGAAVGLAALLQLGQSPLVQTSTGTGFELAVIAAVVLGGTELAGGRGTALGTLLGTVVVALVNDGVVLMRIQPFWSGVVLGGVILGAVALGRAEQGAV